MVLFKHADSITLSVINRRLHKTNAQKDVLEKITLIKDIAIENPHPFLKLVEDKVPFMNGGLFECLDKPDPHLKGRQGGDVILYEDGFSDRPNNLLRVPDYIFFDGDQHADLSDDTGDKKQKDVSVKGLINILKAYKFTVTENTPIEEDIALDPELLGQVFENLLASYNPETKTTARKQTGSFYTPREIVDYMVDESLIAYFSSHLEHNIQPDGVQRALPVEPVTGEARYTPDKLRTLLSYNDLPNPFGETETTQLINAIDVCKILDPACGSGAFPMGILHKLVHCLHKLDPDNRHWQALQRAKILRDTQEAMGIEDNTELSKKLKELNDTFDRNINHPDYARKLFLIENCVYGVDIQPIAIQISKLRFFISLVVDQIVNPDNKNFGILPLPNLETKFVAANTLIGIDKPKAQRSLFDNAEIEAVEAQLKIIRHALFSAKTPKRKRELRAKDEALREQMGVLLVESGWQQNTASQLAAWNPYDQNTGSPFFDSEWMFGISEGFDVVIGNPPYGFRNVLSNEEKNYFRKVQKIEFSSGDSAELFCKISFERLVKEKGILTFIIPKKSLYGDAWEDMRVNYWKKYDLAFILDTGKSFDNVLLEASVFGLIKNNIERKVDLAFLDGNLSIKRFSKTDKRYFFLQNNTCQIYKVLYPEKLFDKIKNKSFNTKKINTKLGLAIGQEFFSDVETNYKLLKGIDIQQYSIRSNRYLKNYDKLKWENVDFFLKPKIISQVIVSHIENPVPHLKITACYDSEGIAITNTLMAFEPIEDISSNFFLGYLNSKFVSWYAYNFIYSRAIRTMHFYDFYIQQIPIPKTPIEQQTPFIELVDKILNLKKQNPAADTKALETQIDTLVYALYALTAEEISIIEGKSE